ncbi:RICIN domain-containing protein [Streptomyces sp. NPDC052721]|uniref:RICIN domain-containing protein n=1 Tax=Streptomyces sp. NPDC052721 TaxID=3154955 RepID=UPI00342D246C
MSADTSSATSPEDARETANPVQDGALSVSADEGTAKRSPVRAGVASALTSDGQPRSESSSAIGRAEHSASAGAYQPEADTASRGGAETETGTDEQAADDEHSPDEGPGTAADAGGSERRGMRSFTIGFRRNRTTTAAESGADHEAQTAAASAGDAATQAATGVNAVIDETDGLPGQAPDDTGRVRRSLLAGAAIAGVALLTVPFLVSTDGDAPKAASAPTEGTILSGGAYGGDGAGVASAAPESRRVRSGAKDAEKHSETGRRGTDGGPDGSEASEGSSPKADGAPREGKDGSHNDDADQVSPLSGDTATRPPASGHTTVSSGHSTGPSVAAVMVSSHASHRCITVSGWQSRDGSPLQIWSCNGSSAQKWQFMSDGTVRAMGKCMDLAGAGTFNGATIQLADCNGGWAQQFRLNAAHDLVAVSPDKCVDVRDNGTSDGTALQLWDCAGTDNQKWSKS